MFSVREFFWMWLLVAIIIYAASAIWQAILVRPMEYSWMKVHILFWITRDVPIAIWGIIWWAWPFFRYGDRSDRIWTVFRVMFSVITLWFVFREAYQFTIENPELFYGPPEKPWWFFW